MTTTILAAPGWAAAFGHPFFQHAVLAGTAIAAAAGLTGYFLVLRAQVFTGDALSHVAFTGALAALALGYDLRLGLFAATIGVALLLGALGSRGRADDVAIGSVFSWTAGPRRLLPDALHDLAQRGRRRRRGQRPVRVDLRPVRPARR